MPGRRDGLSATQSSEVFEAKINAHGYLGFRQRLNIFLDRQTHIVAAITVHRQRDHFGGALRQPGPADIKLSQSRDFQQAAGLPCPLDDALIHLEPDRPSPAFFLAAVFRILRSPFKEVVEGLILIPECLGQHRGRAGLQPGKGGQVLEQGQFP